MKIIKCLLNDHKNQNDIVNVATLFACSWDIRECSSTTVYMVATAEKNAKILEVAMLCNHCNDCEAWKSKRENGEVGGLQFIDWRSIKHFPKLHDESRKKCSGNAVNKNVLKYVLWRNSKNPQ